MKVTLPIYVNKTAKDKFDTHYMCLLFAPDHWTTDENLARGLNQLKKEINQELRYKARENSHYDLMQLCFSPDYEETTVALEIEFKKKILRFHVMLISFRLNGKTLFMTPELEERWFLLPEGRNLKAYAAELLPRLLIEEGERDNMSPDCYGIGVRAWTTILEFDITIPNKKLGEEDDKRILIADDKVANGHEELDKVGICLQDREPRHRAILREKELEELDRVMSSFDCRPVLLVGSSGVGKTALIEEWVARGKERRSVQKIYSGKKGPKPPRVWHLSPQRLISGMSYVGQWEKRLLAILAHAQKNKLVLFFDDVLGLFRAGRSSKSDFSVAHIIKPWLEDRRVRVIAEITPGAYTRLQELDRGFVDYFWTFHVREPEQNRVLRILLRATQGLERQFRCRFLPESLPVIMENLSRFVQDRVMPGKGLDLLEPLAVRYQGKSIDRAGVLAEIRGRTGMDLGFLDDHARLSREQILQPLSRKVIGQTHALEAAADAICMARARLSDPHRPLASFLFLGPTGVGKTQAAKAIASWLYGDEKRLLRFDLNEFVDFTAVDRLVGSFARPEGQLTSAVRRQPFSVVLLDEIEKAHSSVFDLLLQVLGEGRLTDALGRTSWFSNTIVIMTSNLGVREASGSLGFAEPGNESRVYRRAAEKFFRPEFFNRIDRILPFHSLNRDQVRCIANLLMEQVFEREGFERRQCGSSISEAALERVVDFGFHPQLGARALSRAIEQRVVNPLARRLCSHRPGNPAILRISLDESNELAVHLETLNFRKFQPAPRPRKDHAALITDLHQQLEQLSERVSEQDPGGEYSLDGGASAHVHYYALREQYQNAKQALENLEQRVEALQRATPAQPVRPYVPKPHDLVFPEQTPDPAHVMRDKEPASILEDLVRDNLTPGVDGILMKTWQRLRREKAFLETLLDHGRRDDRTLIYTQPLTGGACNNWDRLQQMLRHSCEELGLVIHSERSGNTGEVRIIEVEGAPVLAALWDGIHAYLDEGLRPYQVWTRKLDRSEVERPGNALITCFWSPNRYLDPVSGHLGVPGDTSQAMRMPVLMRLAAVMEAKS